MSLLASPTIASAPLLPAQVGEHTLNKQHNRQLWSWWSYGLAAEAFAAVAMTAFIPLVLEESARSIGYRPSNPTLPCVPSSDDYTESTTCRARIGPFDVDTASFSLYTYSTSVLIQALLIISLSQLANLPSYRKTLLIAFTYIGASASILFPFVTLPALLSLLAMLSIACFGVTSVCFNSFLPTLGKGGDAVRAAKRAWEEERERVELVETHEGGGASGADERPGLMLPGVEFASSDPGEGDLSSTPLLNDLSLTRQAQSTTIDNLYRSYTASISLYTSRISLLSIAIAYSGGAFLLVPSFVLVSALDESFLSLRLAVGLSAAVWALLSIPAVFWLGGWTSAGGSSERGKTGLMRNVTESWAGLGRMLRPREMRKLRNTFVYLFSWVFISDAASTFSSTAIMFAKTTLHMTSSSCVLIAFLAQITGIVGGLACPTIQKRLGWSNRRSIVVLLCAMICLPIYGCVGLLLGGEGAGGLRTPLEMYIVAGLFGLTYGPVQSFSRTVFSELIPPGEEARFFGLYSVTDKSSSFFGPFVVGLLADLTGEIRYGFIFLLVMLSMPLPLLMFKLDVDQGREDAIAHSAARDRVREETDD